MNVDLRWRTSLFCGALAIAIAASILLRRRPGRPQIWFAFFAADIGLWYLAQWLYHFVRADVWARSTAILAVLLPQFALRLFEALLPGPEQRATLSRTALVLLAPVGVLALFGPLERWWVRGAVFLYVFGLLLAGLYSLWMRGRESRSRGGRQRVRFLVLVGAAAVVATLADFLWFLDVVIPPIGAAFSVLFLFVISESLIRQRLVDIYDVLGQVMLSAALASTLAAIFYVFVGLFGGFDTMYLAAFLATIIILAVFEPLREKVNVAIHRTFFRERAVLERAVTRARAELSHVLEVDEMARVVLVNLESSRRATGAAIYLRDPTTPQFDLVQSFGPEPPLRIGIAQVRPLLSSLEQGTPVVLDDVENAQAEAQLSGDAAGAEACLEVLAAAEVLGPFRRSAILPLREQRSFVSGLLLLCDDRVAEAYTHDEVVLLEELARHASVVLQNSLQFRQFQARDRLAVLGQMAAGLAHEVKNPLGAIKGAAQLLDARGPSGEPQADSEFVSIILEEVDRLDRVVGSVLDYARPAPSDPRDLAVGEVLERTVRLLGAEGSSVELVLEIEPNLPLVRADAEQLRQVVINLVRNAIQAMSGHGRVVIGASLVEQLSGSDGVSRLVAISVRDHGPGIADEVRARLFVPFVTTKQRGTGLGLAISQRIVEEMGGRIDVRSRPPEGTTFTILLPARAMGSPSSGAGDQRPDTPSVGAAGRPVVRA